MRTEDDRKFLTKEKLEIKIYWCVEVKHAYKDTVFLPP